MLRPCGMRVTVACSATRREPLRSGSGVRCPSRSRRARSTRWRTLESSCVAMIVVTPHSAGSRTTRGSRRRRPRGVVSSTSTMSPVPRRSLLHARRVRDSQQERAADGARWCRRPASEPGETVEQRGRARSASAENGDALSVVHLEAGAAQHPDACRASRDTGGVALPQGVGAKGERHDPTMVSCVRRSDIDCTARRTKCARRCLASDAPRAIIRDPQRST